MPKTERQPGSPYGTSPRTKGMTAVPRTHSDLDPDYVTHPRLVKARKSGAEKTRASRRRRMIDPTTCERDYSAAEVEFMRAMEAYRRASGRVFPTCSEILEVLGSLGYTKT